MIHFNLSDLEPRQIIPGYHGRIVHSNSMTFVYWHIEKDAPLPAHSHANEQAAHMIEGLFELTIEGETRLLKPGEIAIIPSNSRHWGKAITECKIMDAFCPVREDYR